MDGYYEEAPIRRKKRKGRGPHPCLWILGLVAITAIVLGAIGTHHHLTAEHQDDDECRTFILVADRGDGTISFIDERTEQVETLLIPGEAEPMYLASPENRNEVWVNDRSNDRYLVYNIPQLRVTDEVPFPTGQAAFHGVANVRAKQVWTTCDGNDRVVVVHLDTLEVLAEITDMALSINYQPHDVTVTPSAAFVTWIGKMGQPNSFIARYSTETLTKTGQVEVNPDAHLWYSHSDDRLYVAAIGAIYRVNPNSPTPVIEDSITNGIGGAHGIVSDDRYVYVGDIATSPGKIYRIPIHHSSLIADRVYDLQCDISGIHNLMLSSDSRKLFITRTAFDDVIALDVDRNGHIRPSTERSLYQPTAPMGIARTPTLCGYSKK